MGSISSQGYGDTDVNKPTVLPVTEKHSTHKIPGKDRSNQHFRIYFCLLKGTVDYKTVAMSG
jgi:hypothetical protein